MYKMTLLMLALLASNTLFAQNDYPEWHKSFYLRSSDVPLEQYAQYIINAPAEGKAMTERQRNHSNAISSLFRVEPLDELKRYAIPGGESSIDLLITSYDRTGKFDLMVSQQIWAIRLPLTVNKPESFAEIDERLGFLFKIPKGKWTLSEFNPTRRSFVSSEIGERHPFFNLIYYDRNDQYHLYWGFRCTEQHALVLRLADARNWFKSFEK